MTDQSHDLSLSLSVLSSRLLKSQSADSLLNSDMDTTPPQVTTANHSWLDSLGAVSKELDSASSHGGPQTQEAFLSPLINKGLCKTSLYVCISLFLSVSCYFSPFIRRGVQHRFSHGPD